MKKYLLGMIAVILAVAFSSFSPAKQNLKVVDEVWFVYDGGGESIPANFHYDGLRQGIECEETTGDLCLVLAEKANPMAEPEYWKPDLGTVIYEDKESD